MSFSESQGPTEKNPLVAFSIEKATRVCSVSVGGNVNINSGIRRFIVFKNWAVNVRREAPYVKRISTDLSLSLSLSLSLVPFSLSAENFFFWAAREEEEDEETGLDILGGGQLIEFSTDRQFIAICFSVKSQQLIYNDSFGSWVKVRFNRKFITRRWVSW